MSSTASNYDISKLAIGQLAAAVAFFSACLSAITIVRASLGTILPFLSISLLYGIMMFASSYVEEEQHFWYWATTTWFMFLWLKWYV